MVNVLNRVVSKVIVPRYPWIKDFVWKSKNIGDATFYDLKLIVDDDFYFDYPTYDKLYDDIRTLFKMVEHRENQFFGDIKFST